MDRHDDLYITIVVFANAKNDAAPNTKPPLAYALLTPHHARLTYFPVPKPSSPSFDTVFNLSCRAKKGTQKRRIPACPPLALSFIASLVVGCSVAVLTNHAQFREQQA
jgi:hypothetical protein